MESDRWIENGDFRSNTKSCIHTQWKKSLLDSNVFDRARSKTFLKPTATLTTRKHTITPYKSSDAGLTATAAADSDADADAVVAATAAEADADAYSESAYDILFYARHQRVPSSDGSRRTLYEPVRKT